MSFSMTPQQQYIFECAMEIQSGDMLEEYDTQTLEAVVVWMTGAEAARGFQPIIDQINEFLDDRGADQFSAQYAGDGIFAANH